MDSKADKTGDILSSSGLQDTSPQGSLEAASYHPPKLAQHVGTTVMSAY